jgi:hypothetical protein
MSSSSYISAGEGTVMPCGACNLHTSVLHSWGGYHQDKKFDTGVQIVPMDAGMVLLC